jgi:hypothetical protein
MVMPEPGASLMPFAQARTGVNVFLGFVPLGRVVVLEVLVRSAEGRQLVERK